MSISNQSSPLARDNSSSRPHGPSFTRNGRGSEPHQDGATTPDTLRGRLTPADTEQLGSAEDVDHRDSHDLSFNNRDARASVVDNMLLSLEGISPYSDTFPDEPAPASYGGYQLHSPFPLPPHNELKGSSRQRAHAYSSSYASDYDLPASTASSRYSSQRSRGRRSVSSSHIGNNDLGKTDNAGVGEGGYEADTYRRTPQTRKRLRRHRRGGGKGSTASASSSLHFRYCQVETISWDTGDQSISVPAESADSTRHDSGTNMFAESMLSRPRPKGPAPFHGYDTGALSSSRRLSTGLRSTPIYTGSPSSKRTCRVPTPPPKDSPRSRGSNRGRPDVMTDKSTETDRPLFRDMSLEPSSLDPSAPSPTIALLNKSDLAVGNITLSRERPSFFRRVFGSSRAHSQAFSEDYQPALQRDSSGTRTPGSMSSAGLPITHGFDAADHNQLPSVSNYGVSPANLYKKPSSFFRRRKKSASDLGQASVPMLNLGSVRGVDPLLPSPSISSLRKVMNPYLDSPRTPAHHEVDSRGGRIQTRPDGVADSAAFSSGHMPQEKSSIREVRLWSQDNAGAASQPGEDMNASQAETSPPGLDVPGSLQKLEPSRPLLGVHSGNSVLGTRHLGNQADALSASQQSPTTHLTGSNKQSVTGVFTPGSSRPRTPPQENEPPLTGGSVGNENTSRSVSIAVDEQAQPTRKAYFYSGPSAVTPPQDPVVLSAPIRDDGSPLAKLSTIKRVWLRPSSSEAILKRTAVHPALDGIEGNAAPGPNDVQLSEQYKSPRRLSSTKVEDEARNSIGTRPGTTSTQEIPDSEPSAEELDRALKLFNGESEILGTSEGALLLGDVDDVSKRTRQAYMQLFTWHNQNILTALRGLCGRLILKGETQQVDRILDSFAQRWCGCNPNHGFKSTDVVHTICYSLLLLNTDLHVADIEQKMSRNQFVKNTMPTIRRAALAMEPDAQDTVRVASAQARGSIPWSSADSTSPFPPPFMPTIPVRQSSLEPTSTLRRRSFLPTQRPDLDGATPADSTDLLVNAPCDGGIAAWENQIEATLKGFYNSVRQQALPLYGAPTPRFLKQTSSNNLSVRASNVLRRSPSVLSKAPSENISLRSGRGTVGRWAKPSRSRPKLLAASAQGSSRSSFDESSIFSPAASSTWSKYSWGKTATTMSVESFVSNVAHRGEYQQHSIGFANALSQAIIREEEGTSPVENTDCLHHTIMLEDETLELAGAPWAKEGIVKHKHHLESGDKKSRDRHWNECFAVIERGWMRLFSFSAKSSSIRHKQRNREASGGISTVVGGGNWSENAEELVRFMLRQTIASALPPPGYSKNRPWVFALSLPTGAVHLFEVGTPEIVMEFVSTANYWSARQSKEPLVGGVSSVEYGWSETILNSALAVQREHDDVASSVPVISTPMYHGHPPQSTLSVSSEHVHRDLLRPSTQSSSGSGSWDHSSIRVSSSRSPADGAKISEWTPPQQSLMASALDENEQIARLREYVHSVETELREHQDLRPLVATAFSPRHPNAAKAMANWEKKSSYLLREVVKFRTYIDSLAAAETAKQKLKAEKGLHSDEGVGSELEESRPATDELEGAGVYPHEQRVTSML